MNFQLTEEQKLIQKTAREFAAEHLAPGVADRDEKMEFPAEQIKMLGEMGFMGMMVPEDWGGPGFDTVSYSLALEEIAKVDASAAVPVSVNNSLVCALLYKYGTDDQKEKEAQRALHARLSQDDREKAYKWVAYYKALLDEDDGP